MFGLDKSRVATVLTACGIETLARMYAEEDGYYEGCNSTYRLRY